MKNSKILYFILFFTIVYTQKQRILRDFPSQKSLLNLINTKNPTELERGLKSIPFMTQKSRKQKQRKLKKHSRRMNSDVQQTSFAPPLIAMASAWVSFRNYQQSHEKRELELKKLALDEKDYLQRIYKAQQRLGLQLGALKTKGETVLINVRGLLDNLEKKELMFKNSRNALLYK